MGTFVLLLITTIRLTCSRAASMRAAELFKQRWSSIESPTISGNELITVTNGTRMAITYSPIGVGKKKEEHVPISARAMKRPNRGVSD